MKRWPVLLAVLCLLLAAGCFKPKWPKNQDAAVERRVIAFIAKDSEVDEHRINRSTRLSDFYDEEDMPGFLKDLALDFGVTVPDNTSQRVRTVGDVIDLMGYLSAQQPHDEKGDQAVPEEMKDK